jgi:hypothetical protein
MPVPKEVATTLQKRWDKTQIAALVWTNALVATGSHNTISLINQDVLDSKALVPSWWWQVLGKVTAGGEE